MVFLSKQPDRTDQRSGGGVDVSACRHQSLLCLHHDAMPQGTQVRSGLFNFRSQKVDAMQRTKRDDPKLSYEDK
jgi:hypothetical protein